MSEMLPRPSGMAADDALSLIYELEHDEGDNVIAARLAERLKIRPASVAGMIGRLKRDGLVEVNPHGHISLTDVGHRRAEQTVRRHRLAECLLVEILGLDWSRAHGEAHLLEHAITDATEPLIALRLNHPRRSPFGYQIPGSAEAEPHSNTRLSDLLAGTAAIIERVYEDDEELLRFCESEGIQPGTRIVVVDAPRYRQMLTVSINGREVVLGRLAASRMWVEE